MKKTIGVQTLIGMTMPCYQDETRKMIDGWRPYLTESTQAINLDNLSYIEFRNNRGDKVWIYQSLVRAFEKGWFKITKIELARYLAMHTNLATNPDVEQRTKTIYHFLKLYKKYFTRAA